MNQAQSPILECDLVMKGGITSGVVYPRAVAELSHSYRFRGIAGTSAGALAAAATAAAEYGRRKHVRCKYRGEELEPFDRLDLIPAELGEAGPQTKLSRLFQPQPSTAPFLNLALTGLAGGIQSVVWSIAKGSFKGVALAVLPGLIAGLAIGGEGGVMIAVLISVPSAILALLSSIRRIVRNAEQAVPDNMYGLCTGLTVPPGKSGPGLTDWLHELIQSLAGRTGDERPLTMGDLWLLENYRPEKRERLKGNMERAIDLALMTSNITQGRSHRFPNLIDWSGSLYFKKEDFDRLFPKPVVDWMVEKGRRTLPFGDELFLEVPDGYYHLPWPEHLPVLFGARISMSFPFLLSAIPLYVFDLSVLKEIIDSQVATEHENFLKCLSEGTQVDPAEEASWNEYWAQQMRTVPLKKCWFSDGGVTSNFPIHFFDGPLARRPTFAINLTTPTTRITTVRPPTASENPDAIRQKNFVQRSESMGIIPAIKSSDKAWDYIFMPEENEEGAARVVRFNDFEKSGGKLFGFFSALFDTSRNWADTEQTFMPSYRDRIVHVMLEPNEGGLNLQMPADVIKSVGHRGRLAAQMLAARFDPQSDRDPKSGKPVTLTWNNHRWVRYRTFMAALEQILRQFAHVWREERDHPERLPAGVVPMPELLRKGMPELVMEEEGVWTAVEDYWWSSTEQMRHATEATEALVNLAEGWTGPHQTFDAPSLNPDGRGRSPRPKGQLRVVPSYELVIDWGEEPEPTATSRSLPT